MTEPTLTPVTITEPSSPVYVEAHADCRTVVVSSGYDERLTLSTDGTTESLHC